MVKTCGVGVMRLVQTTCVTESCGSCLTTASFVWKQLSWCFYFQSCEGVDMFWSLQYLTMVELLESIDCMVKNAPYRKFRPDVCIQSSARLWSVETKSLYSLVYLLLLWNNTDILTVPPKGYTVRYINKHPPGHLSCVKDRKTVSSNLKNP